MGFSFLDKDGDLAGSYTVDIDDGYVTEYDEDGGRSWIWLLIFM